MQISQLTTPNRTLFTLTQTFRYLNCCCNFFLYSATSSLFRRQLQEIFQCSNLLKTKQKTINKDVSHRTKMPLSPSVYSANKDTILSERKNLLSTTKTTVENLNPTDLANGHTVSFKT